MARVAGIHGILNEFSGEYSLAKEWEPAVRDGLKRVGFVAPDSVDVRIAFYGDLFRDGSASKNAGFPLLSVEDLTGDEQDLLLALSNPLEFAAQTKAPTPRSLQAALRALMDTRFFELLAGQFGERALLFGLRQVRLYLHDEQVRMAAQRRLGDAICPDTTVVIGHSLGSVIAYEALCTGAFPQIRAFVSLGSPLGMRPIVFGRLRPAPESGRGSFPDVAHWTNVADDGDLVALEKTLAPLFGTGTQVTDLRTRNGWESHSVLRYLTSKEAGLGISLGL